MSTTEDKSSTAQRDELRRRSDLDNRYGKIGISAVAAAVGPKGEQPRTDATVRRVPYDRD